MSGGPQQQQQQPNEHASTEGTNNPGLSGATSTNNNTNDINNDAHNVNNTPTGDLDDPRSSSHRGHMSVVWGMLAKLLPVLNGMVYSDGAVREYVWRHGHGVAVLLHMVTRALPLELRVVTVFTLANLTQRYTTLPPFVSSAGFYRSSPFCFAIVLCCAFVAPSSRPGHRTRAREVDPCGHCDVPVYPCDHFEPRCPGLLFPRDHFELMFLVCFEQMFWSSWTKTRRRR